MRGAFSNMVMQAHTMNSMEMDLGRSYGAPRRLDPRGSEWPCTLSFGVYQRSGELADYGDGGQRYQIEGCNGR
jgi:hypothetical protein